MGCDIHAMIEYSVDGRKWKAGPRVRIGRNYEIFSILGNVRNIHTPHISYISDSLFDLCKREMKSLEKCCSKKFAKWLISCKSDAHHPSYVTLKNLLDYFHNKQFQKDHVQQIKDWIKSDSYENGHGQQLYTTAMSLLRIIHILEDFYNDLRIFKNHFKDSEKSKKYLNMKEDQIRLSFFFDN